MMSKSVISEISRSLIGVAWHFGPNETNDECCGSLTMPEFIALDKISITHECAVQEVGTSLGFTKSGSTKIVNRLEKKGYIKKIKSEKDARYCCLEVSDIGRTILKHANKKYLNQFKNLLKKMPGIDEASATKVINAFGKAICR